jgi:hypothetical protein
MRFHYGLGVGHVYSHEKWACSTTQLTARTEHEALGRGETFSKHTHWRGPANDDGDDEQDDDGDYVGAEELDFFDQGLDASTESLTQALDEMFTTGHSFDYEIDNIITYYCLHSHLWNTLFSSWQTLTHMPILIRLGTSQSPLPAWALFSLLPIPRLALALLCRIRLALARLCNNTNPSTRCGLFITKPIVVCPR